jgi:putative salt-induced outer membrane protein YdiY
MKSTQSLKFIVLVLCSLGAQADEILLKNGDRISGTVISKSGKLLEIKTAYAEKIVIKWDAVQTLKTDKPLSITLSDKQELIGIASTAADGSVILNSSGVYNTQPIPLANIKEINKKSFSGSANIGGNMADGNTNRNSFHSDADVTMRGRDDKVTFGGQYNYADAQVAGINALNARNFQMYGNYSHFFSDRAYGYAHGLFTNDRFQDIQLRSAFGIGAGYEIFSSEDLNLSFEAGPDYVSVNRYDHPYIMTGCQNGTNKPCNLPDEASIAGRWAVNYDQFFFNRGAQLFHKHEGIIGNGLFVRTRTGFHMPLWNGIQFTNEVQLDYYDKNADFGKKTVDTRYLFSLGYGW